MADNDDPKKTRAYEKQTSEHESAEADNVGQALRTLSVQVGAFLDEVKADRNTNTREHQKDRYWQRIIAGIGTATSVLTLAVLIKTCSVYNKILTTENTQATIMATQAAIMQGQREITEKTLPAMQEQARAASTQAAASLASAEAAKQAIEAGQRPILAPKFGAITLVTGQIPEWHFEVDNLGKIPALYVIVNYCSDVVPIPPDTFILPDCGREVERTPSVIFPTNPQLEFAYGKSPLSADDLNSTRTGQKSFYAMGTITYTDVSKAQYFTKFCVRYPSVYRGPIKLPADQYQVCPNPDSNDAN